MVFQLSLAPKQTTPKLSGTKQPCVFADSVDQEFGQGTVGLCLPCSMMPGASVGVTLMARGDLKIGCLGWAG